jgi:hypothetical protein
VKTTSTQLLPKIVYLQPHPRRRPPRYQFSHRSYNPETIRVRKHK